MCGLLGAAAATVVATTLGATMALSRAAGAQCESSPRAPVYISPCIPDKYNPVVAFTFARRERRRWLPLRARVRTVGTATVEVFDRVAPMAARNFYELCRGTYADKTGHPLHYGRHMRIDVRGGNVYGGETVTHDDGAVCVLDSIYGADFPAMTALGAAPHARGLVAATPLPNGRLCSRFVVVLSPATALQPMVPLGQVRDGMDVLYDVAAHVGDEQWVCACRVAQPPKTRRTATMPDIYVPQ